MQNEKIDDSTQLELISDQGVFDLTIKKSSKNFLQKNYKYEMNDKITVSRSEFFNRLNNKFGDLFDNFDWSNTIMSGGLIYGLIETKYDPQEYANSDIDLFIYGDETTVKEKMQYIYNYFVIKLNKKFFAFIHKTSSIITIVIPCKISVQIIYKQFRYLIDIFKFPDFTHCQVGYDGSNILYTNEFIEAITTKVTKFTKIMIRNRHY